MELDIRDLDEEDTIDKIRFGSPDEYYKLSDIIWSEEFGSIYIGNSQHIHKGLLMVGEEIDNLIKALHKAKELGWY